MVQALIITAAAKAVFTPAMVMTIAITAAIQIAACAFVYGKLTERVTSIDRRVEVLEKREEARIANLAKAHSAGRH